MIKESSSFFHLIQRIYIWLGQKKNFFRWVRAEDDFVLRVAPLHDTKSKAYRDYHPPPGYGVPAGKEGGLSDEDTNFSKYGLFLWPGEIARRSFRSVFFTHLFTPFVFILTFGWFPEEWTLFSSIFFFLAYFFSIFLIALTALFYLNWSFSKSPTVLSSIWADWPESQYSKFLNVPYLSILSWKDIGKYEAICRKSKDQEPDKQKRLKLYWKPDKPIPIKYQSAYYAKGTRTLQEVLMHLAVFDFLFKSKMHVNNQRKASTVNHELDENSNEFWKSSYQYLLKPTTNYLFKPILINYFTVLGFFLLFSLCVPPSNLIGEFGLLLHYPFFFTVPVLFWLWFSIKHAREQKAFLIHLYDDIRSNYFNAHLELVPQQILNLLNTLPDEDHVKAGVNNIDNIQRLILTVGIVSFFGLMEIFSSGFGEPLPDKEFASCWMVSFFESIISMLDVINDTCDVINDEGCDTLNTIADIGAINE